MSSITYGEALAERLGADLRRRRRALGLRQIEVAELAGTTQRTVSVIENGHPGSRLETIAAIAEALGLTLVAVAHDDLAASEADATGPTGAAP